jgi:type I restriction enzyme S subunit
LKARLNRSALHHLTTASDDAALADHWRRLRENFNLLYDVPETVTELRQTVLQLAVRGKLAPQCPTEGLGGAPATQAR